MKKLRDEFTDDEDRLLGNVAGLSNIPDNCSHIHVDLQVVASLETNTRLSLERADQFDYSILRHHRVTGALLLEPPGTGKTMMAQAMAKATGLNMLSVSSGDVLDKMWGGDEQNIRAAFKLARRLHPCIMFIDEADGILGRRKENDHKNLRAMLSEFLREWDGVSPERQRNPFVLLATNMPWDLDPAILRRAPVRILLDIPTHDQRIGILNVLLREETLEQDLSIESLAWLTRAFTGSDLKSLCVSAALRSIEEQKRDKDGKYPEKRTLCKRHFDLALQNIKPSVANKFLLKRLADFKRGGA